MQDGRSASLTAPSGQAQGGLIMAAVSDAAATADEMTLNEAHGTGTPLGDPIEAGSLVAAVLSLRSEQAAPLALGGVKANIGHAEPAAGMTGLLKLASGLENATAAPNAQMRVLNPMVSGAFRGLSCALAAQPAAIWGATQAMGGVSSFGYSGTIAHAVLCREADAPKAKAPARHRSGSKRHAFMWCDAPHPFVQRCMPLESDGAITFRSPAMGALHDLVADHVVLGRIIFPAVGYLEMARAAAATEEALHGVFFLNPLAVETPGLLIECVVSDGRFEVRSGEDDDSLDEAAAHCAGAYASVERWQRVELASVRASSCARGASIGELYDGFKSSGLQYGISFRRLVQGWGGANSGAAKLQARASSRTAMHAHPADLDDALCASALMDPSAGSAASETRLPFAVDEAQLQKAPGGLWAVVSRQNAEASMVRLGALAGPSQAQLGGFRMRAVKAEPPTQKHLYMTEWLKISEAKASEVQGTTLVISNGDATVCERLSSRVTREELAMKAQAGAWSSIAVVMATEHGIHASLPLFVLETALMLVQTPVTTVPAPNFVLLTKGAQGMSRPAQAGPWGLARSARTEASLPVLCLDGPASTVHSCTVSAAEPEVVMHLTGPRAPRLRSARQTIDGLVRLHFHARGAISNLFLETLPTFPPLVEETEVLLHVRAVGLNFRDVLNVLGEYPGDPGPPGGDSSGVTSTSLATPDTATDETIVFGLGHAPLACVAVAVKALLTRKSAALSFEQASTLPVTWSTTHTALQRAQLRAGRTIIAQAAAGGVGLKAVEYAQWLFARCVGTAGRPHKHAVVNAAGVRSMCSSRDGAAFAVGATRLLSAGRSHAVFNSLSLDFIAASFASLGEGGAFEEIGKRGVWSLERHLGSALVLETSTYNAIALDADMVLDPIWMHGVLSLLAARTGAGSVSSLPLDSFDMEARHELAFRYLQGGLNLGKVVVRIGARETRPRGSHVVTGGTGGLGLLTGRWLAQRGACKLMLASRSGALARDTATEWESIQATDADAALVKCDTSEAKHVRRLVAFAPLPLQGMWHAAGALADAVLHKQNAAGLALVYAPKAHGAWNLHGATITADMQACACFSSVVAMLGGAGQANYGAANTCLDALSTCRRSRGVAAASVQWGAWAEIGMAARGAASERMDAMAAASGFGRIALAQGLAALGTATRHISPAVLGLAPIVWSRFVGDSAAPALLQEFAAPSQKRKGAAGQGTAKSAASGVSLESVLEMVKRTAGGAVDADAPLMESGVDSLGAVELRNQLQSAAGSSIALPSTLVFDYPTARQLASKLEPKQAAGAATAPRNAPVPQAAGRYVSIDGVSALFPGGAPSLAAASTMVACGLGVITQVPATRWDVHTQPSLAEPVASRVRHLGFVRDAELADNAAFGVSHSEASAMDPCQRLVLERGYAALADADLKRAALNGSLTGVFLGFAGTDFSRVLMKSPCGQQRVRCDWFLLVDRLWTHFICTWAAGPLCLLRHSMLCSSSSVTR